MLKNEYIENLIPRLTERQIEKRYIPKYLKPKIIHDEYGQYPYRCPICWQKYILKELAQNCLDSCWASLPDLVWKTIERLSKEPKEVGSWQWDLDDQHKEYCGVVLYDNGDLKFFKGYPSIVFITEDELITLLNKGGYLFQIGKFELPEKLKRFTEYPKAKRECPNRTFLLKKTLGVG